MNNDTTIILRQPRGLVNILGCCHVSRQGYTSCNTLFQGRERYIRNPPLGKQKTKKTGRIYQSNAVTYYTHTKTVIQIHALKLPLT